MTDKSPSPKFVQTLRHFDIHEMEKYGSLRVEVSADEHDGIKIVCSDAMGGRTEVWLENDYGVLALRAFIPDMTSVNAGEKKPGSSESPILNSRLALGKSIMLVGDIDSQIAVAAGIEVDAGDGETFVAERTRLIKHQQFNNLLDSFEITNSFPDWIARIEAELASTVEPEAWEDYYFQGLSPAAAVLKSREHVMADG